MRYTSIFATREHAPITKLSQMKRYDNVLGLLFDGEVIGTGELDRRKNKSKVVSTSGTEIFQKYRNKGHGIHLYIELIETARRIGAKQIRSDVTLNKYSKKMWAEKLPKLYPVRIRNTRKPCSCCENTRPHRKYYYINL